MSLKKSWNFHDSFFRKFLLKVSSLENFFLRHSCGLQKTQRAWWCLGGPSSSWWPMQRRFKPENILLLESRFMPVHRTSKSMNLMRLITSPCCFDVLFIGDTPKNDFYRSLYSENRWGFDGVFHLPGKKKQVWGRHNFLLEALQILHLRLRDGLHRPNGLPPIFPSWTTGPKKTMWKQTTEPTPQVPGEKYGGRRHLGGDVGRFAYRSIRTFTQLLLVQLVVVLRWLFSVWAMLFKGWFSLKNEFPWHT